MTDRGLLGIGDRPLAIWLFIVFTILAALVVVASVALTVLMGWAALILVVPFVLIAAPPITYMLYDTAHTAYHNDILWRTRR